MAIKAQRELALLTACFFSLLQPHRLPGPPGFPPAPGILLALWEILPFVVPAPSTMPGRGKKQQRVLRRPVCSSSADVVPQLGLWSAAFSFIPCLPVFEVWLLMLTLCGHLTPARASICRDLLPDVLISLLSLAFMTFWAEDRLYWGVSLLTA